MADITRTAIRFATLNKVIEHYDKHLSLQLSDKEKADLIEYLKSI
jgi:hypothetical protein